MNFIIKSITGQIHDTGFGGYPYKVVVIVEMPAKEYTNLKKDLGQLVVNVNNAVYDVNTNIDAHNPSIDSQGSRNAKNGVKTLEFVYFSSNHERAIKLGFKTMILKSGEYFPKYNDRVKVL